MASLQRSRSAALLGLLSLVLVGQAPAPSVDNRPVSFLPLPQIAKDLAELGVPVTAGAAPGFADEASCALCHRKIADTYRAKGMARAFRSPRPENDIEDFAAPPFTHAPSGQKLQISRSGGRLVFRRWQTDAGGQPINIFETPVDWILGSGDHARTYLYRTESGELFQLPLAWYSQERRWHMAPGFDRPDHDGVLRRVRRECIFCHTSYPDVPAGADAYGAPQVFPARLPEGVGCQRCHGPAAEHVWLAMGGIGYVLRKFEYDLAPIALGLVLAPMLELSLRQSLAMSAGDYGIFLERPIATTMFALGFVLFLFALKPVVFRKGRDWRRNVGLEQES